MARKNKTHDIDKTATVQRQPEQVPRTASEHERPVSSVIALQRATSAPPAALRPADILTLQRAIGNRAVQRLLSGQARRTPAAEEAQGGQPIQTKLTIGPAGDKYEQEADRVASQVMSMDVRPDGQSLQRTSEQDEEDLQRKPAAISITPLVQRVIAPEDEEQHNSSIQRQADSASATAELDIEQALRDARGRGQALPPELRAHMGPAFGVDFSGVRVHTDAQADSLNRALQARAFTTGPDLFFKRGAYEPSSRAGQELIAHELTHVVQQADLPQAAGAQVNKSPALIQRKFTILNPALNVTKASEVNLPAGHKAKTQAGRAILDEWANLPNKVNGDFANWQAVIDAADGEAQLRAQHQQHQQQQQQAPQPKAKEQDAGEWSDAVAAKVKKAKVPHVTDPIELDGSKIYPDEAIKNKDNPKRYGTHYAAKRVNNHLKSLGYGKDTSFKQVRISEKDNSVGRIYIGNAGTYFWSSSISHIEEVDRLDEAKIYWFDKNNGWVRVQ